MGNVQCRMRAGRSAAGCCQVPIASALVACGCCAVRVRGGVGLWECSGVGVERDSGTGWDFFISYTQADRAWAEWIAWVLEEDGTSADPGVGLCAGSNWVQGMRMGSRGPTGRSRCCRRTTWIGVWDGGVGGGVGQTRRARGRKLLTVRVRSATGRISWAISSVSICLASRKLKPGPAAEDGIRGDDRPGQARRPPGFPGGRAIARQRGFPLRCRGCGGAARNPNFTGRNDDLAALAAALAAGTPVTVQAVAAWAVSARPNWPPSSAMRTPPIMTWSPDRCRGISRAAGPVHRAGRDLGLEAVSDPEGLQAQIHRSCGPAAGWLLIFDNAGAPDEFQPWIPGPPLLPGTPAM